MSQLLDVAQKQYEITRFLQELFVNDSLQICDNTKNLGFYDYDHNISFPWGNLKYGQMCVDEYV